MSDYFLALTYFIIGNSFLLVFFSIPFVTPQLIRLRRLKQIARKYNLNFESRFLKDHNFFARKDHIRKNVISGTLHGKNILIYDSLGHRSIPFYTDIAEAMFHNRNSYSLSRRSTHLVVNGVESRIDNETAVGYAHIKQVESALENLLDTHS